MKQRYLATSALTVTVIALSGCNQNDSSDLSSYTGNTQPAYLSSAVVANQFIDNVSAVTYSLTVSDLTGTRTVTRSLTPRTLLTPESTTTAPVTKTATTNRQPRTLQARNIQTNLANLKVARSVDDTYVGLCGGYLDYVGFYDNQTDYIDVTARASNYCDNQQVYNGYFYLEGYGEYSDYGYDLNIGFEAFNYRDDYYGVNYTLNGQSRFQEAYPLFFTTSNMVIRDRQLRKTYMLRNWQEVVDEGVYPENQTLSGELYDGSLGYVNISTIDPLVIGAYDYPESGQLRLRGDRSVAWVTFYGSGYLIEVDANNDGYLDDEGLYRY